MRDELVQALVLSAAFAMGACQSQDQSPASSDGGTAGGPVAQDGGAGQATGGAGNAPGSAGASNSSGGSSSGVGNAAGSRANGAGAAGVATGGAPDTGGGNPGGASSTGGSGTTSSGGAASGGAQNTGGSAAGGMAGSGGPSTDPPCPVQPPRTGGMQYCNPPANGNAGGGYSYDLWSDAKGTGCMTVYGVDAAFKANWMNVGDWIARVGLSFDKSKTYDQLGTFSSDFSYTMTGITTGGFGNVGIYGWSVSPLHEFYIEENWLGKAPNFTKVGTFTIDGEGTYDVMTNTQTNQPNITGTNATFVQFWSVRTSKRQCGHISISKHFDEWASLGLQLGKMEEIRMSVEGQNNSGTIDFTTATVVVK